MYVRHYVHYIYIYINLVIYLHIHIHIHMCTDTHVYLSSGVTTWEVLGRTFGAPPRFYSQFPYPISRVEQGGLKVRWFY